MILSLLKGLGSAILHVKDVRSFLSLLLERRSQHYIELHSSSPKLSGNEIRILCLLLEVNSISSPSDLQLSMLNESYFPVFDANSVMY